MPKTWTTTLYTNLSNVVLSLGGTMSSTLNDTGIYINI